MKKLKPSLDSVIHEPCPYCDGLGMVVSRATMAQKARKQVMKLFYETDCRAVVIKAHPANTLRNRIHDAWRGKADPAGTGQSGICFAVR